MDWTILSMLYAGIIAVVLYYHYSRLCNAGFRWYWCLCYAAMSCALAVCQAKLGIGEFFYDLLGILLLAVFGTLSCKCKFVEAFALSSLVISIYSIAAGLMQSFTFLILSLVNEKVILLYADLVSNTCMILLLAGTFHIVRKHLFNSIKDLRLSFLMILVVPVIFITLAEAVVSDSIYGSTVVWDTGAGLVFPIVNNVQMLVLRLFAYGGLFSILTAYKKMKKSIEHEQTIRLLEQQAQNQEVYIKEAQQRYEQTRSFRHDIKNHLLVLKQLIKAGKTSAASDYLTDIKAVSDVLSFQVQTGNAAVDALLNCKLGIAEQNGISIQCSMPIPNHSFITDMDWCIILSNAIDNVIKASEAIAEQDRWIHLSGIQKGNAYLLSIENRCRKNTKQPLEGIGLTNIRAVIQKYNGKMEIEVTDEIFRLILLLIIPQHLGDIPQQSH